MSDPGFQIYSQSKFSTKAMPHLLIAEVGRKKTKISLEEEGEKKEEKKK